MVLIPLLFALAGCGGSGKSAEANLEPLRKAATTVKSLAATPTAGEKAAVRGGLIERIAGRRAAALLSPREAESPRDQFVRLKADQNVHIRRGLPFDDWHAKHGITRERMTALEDEFWLDPAVRADVLKRTQDALNANRKPMR